MNALVELRAAARRLLRAPASSAALVVVLALGIGANSAIFSVVDALLFRALPVSEPERLVRFQMSEEKGSGMQGGVSFPLFEDLRADLTQERLLQGLAAFSNGAAIDLSARGGEAERVSGAVVSGEFFSVLGVIPQHGRLLGPADDGSVATSAASAAGEPVVVLSDGLWRRAFGADPAAVGTKVLINRHDFLVVGVAPPRFRGPTFEDAPDLWVSLAQAPIAMPDILQFKPFERRGFAWLEVVGRLASGAADEQVQARLDVLARRSIESGPTGAAGKAKDPFPWADVVPAAAATLSGERRATVDRLSWLLLGAAGLVLLVACSVAAGLLLVRGERRQRELAIRQAIGASSARVARELLFESALLAALSAVVGGCLAAVGLAAFARIGPTEFALSITPPSPSSDPRVLSFTAAIAVVATLLFGALPALRGGRVSFTSALKGELRHAPGLGRRLSLRDGFVVLQVALSALLLVGAGLFLRTLARASAVELGFDADRAVSVQLDVSRQGYGREAAVQFYGRLLERVRGLPGVSAAATAYHVPVQEANALTSVQLTNVAPPSGDSTSEPRVAFSAVSQGFFAALGVELERGRDFDAVESAQDGAPVVIVNRAFADRFWPGLDPLAQRVLNFGDGGAAVVGVVPTLRNTSVREDELPFLYVPAGQFHTARRNLVVRTEGDPRALVPMLRLAILELDRNLPQIGMRTLRERAGLALAQERVLAGLLATFGALALTLAALGVYSVMAYAAEVRTHEFGVRLALGAEPLGLLRLVLLRALTVVGLGAATGLAAALAATRSIATLLFGVPSSDGVTFAAIGLLLVLVGLLASALPALRAAHLDPMTVLRQD